MTEKTKSELAAEERAKINVTTTNKDEKVEDKEDDKVEDKEEDKEEEKEEDKEIEDKKDDEDKEEDKEEKEEKEDEEVEAKPSAEKLEKTIERLQRRIDKKTGNERQLQKELNDLKAQLAAKEADGDKLTSEDVKVEAARIASEEMVKRDFENACDRLNKDALKLDKKFDDKIQALAEDIGGIPGPMIGILDDLDNGAEVLVFLTDNVDDAERLWGLKSVGKMALEVAKISNKLERAKEVKPKKISNAPAPKEAVKGITKTQFDPANTKLSDKEWIEERNKQVAERRAAKLAAMR